MWPLLGAILASRAPASPLASKLMRNTSKITAVAKFIRAARQPYDGQHHQGRDGQISARNEPGWGALFWIKISPPCFSSVAIGLRCARIVQLACDIAGNVGISD